jgi:hypothetical protein
MLDGHADQIASSVEIDQGVLIQVPRLINRGFFKDSGTAYPCPQNTEFPSPDPSKGTVKECIVYRLAVRQEHYAKNAVTHFGYETHVQILPSCWATCAMGFAITRWIHSSEINLRSGRFRIALKYSVVFTSTQSEP